jgi:uncharacterized protein
MLPDHGSVSSGDGPAQLAHSPTHFGLPTPLSREQCLQCVARAQYGRIIYTSGALPAVTPVSFKLLDNVVRFKISSQSELAGTFEGAVLAFHVDGIDATAGHIWSVTITGRAREILDDDPQPAAPDSLHFALTPQIIAGNKTAVRLGG